MTSKEVARTTGLSIQRVQQWARSIGKQPTESRKRGGRPVMFDFTEEEVEKILKRKGKFGPQKYA